MAANSGQVASMNPPDIEDEDGGDGSCTRVLIFDSPSQPPVSYTNSSIWVVMLCTSSDP